jgi:hypothetical protein
MTGLDLQQAEKYQAALDIINNSTESVESRFSALAGLFNKLVRAITNRELMIFRNFYARFRFVFSSIKLTEAEYQNIDAFRRFVRSSGQAAPGKTAVTQGVLLLQSILNQLQGHQTPMPAGFRPGYFAGKLPPRDPASAKTVKVLCHSWSELHTQDDEVYFILKAYNLENLGELLTIHIRRYQYTDFTYTRNIITENTVLLLQNVSSLETPHHYSTNIDSLLVLEPDFLIDASAIGECFTSGGTNPNIFFLSRLIENLPGAAALKGSLVGYHLDEMVRNSTQRTTDIFITGQRNNALRAAQLGRIEMQTIRESIKKDHLPKIQRLVDQESHKELWIEPTYFSSSYGLQGRLDLLAIDSKLDTKDIIELKSGSPSTPNLAIAWANHKMQVVSYDLLLKSTYGQNRRGFNAVFYSKCDVEPYRNIVSDHKEWNAALRVRNEIVARIYTLAGSDFSLLQQIKQTGIPGLPRFSEAELSQFQNLYDPGKITTQYYQELLAFTLREMINAKVGDLLSEEQDEENGFASLWMNDLQAKTTAFRMIPDLTVTSIDEENGHIFLSITTEIPHAFRKGDLVVMYPRGENGYNCMSQHILKGSIKELGLDTLTVSIYNKQTAYNFIHNHTYWAIEPDLFERNFWSTFSCLFNVLRCSYRKKKLLLGHEAPGFDNLEFPNDGSLTTNQHATIRDALNAHDYYLLQGPPGTGKTSTFLVNYVRESLLLREDKIIVLAFTNNAVEKICESFRQPLHGAPIPYLRIGSKYVEDEFLFTGQLPDDNPDHWRSRIDNTRVFISTVASFQNNLLLLKQFMQFKHVVIDEASQLTEAQLVGILSSFDKFVLIGDHKQLPSVVTQDEQSCLTPKDSHLDKLGIKDLRISLFERLIRNAITKEWHQAHGQLTDHYRMHDQIASLIRKHYSSGLVAGIARQLATKKPYALPAKHMFFPLCKSRTLFIESLPETVLKRNKREAQMVVLLVKMLTEEAKVSLEDIGIITPFRAQIVEIKKLMPEAWQANEHFVIDTVERFQGGQKKVIIFSTTISNPRQINSIQSITTGDMPATDRKLLVSLSRAEEQVIILGNPDALCVSEEYKALMEACQQNEGYLDRTFSEKILN